MSKRNTADVMRNCRETLEAAREGLEFIKSDPKRRRFGLRNLATFGRSVTFVIQTLSSCEPGFEKWYLPKQEKMKVDPLLKYFLEMRNEILKQGSMPAGTGVYLNLKAENIPPKPSWASSFTVDGDGNSYVTGEIERTYARIRCK